LAFQSRDLSDDADCQAPSDAEPGARFLAAQTAAAFWGDPVRDNDYAVSEIGEGFDEALAHGVGYGDQRARLADSPGVKRIRFDRVEMMARDEEPDRIPESGGDPRGDAAKCVIARQMGMQNIDPIFADRIGDALSADHVQGVAQPQLIPLDRVA